MIYAVREGRLSDCGALVRRLRREQQSVAQELGANAHAQLRAAYAASGFTRAWVIDGRVVALMGVTGPVLATEGEVWLALSEEATRFPRAIIREARKAIEELAPFKHRLTASPYLSDPASVRFAQHLGFIESDEQGKRHESGPTLRRHVHIQPRLVGKPSPAVQ